MKITTKKHHLQTLANGVDTLNIVSHHIDTQSPGPKVYLQANLHGAEIMGTVVLKKLLQKIKVKKQLNIGGLTVVPSANPIGLLDKSYSGINGRRSNTGKNWNRIFTTSQNWNSKQEELQYYKDKLNQDNPSIEQQLAATLKQLSYDADYIIDLHTTNSTQTISFLFTHPKSKEVFNPLDPQLIIEWTEDDAIGAFDESHILFHQEQNSHACTWEVGKNNEMKQNQLNQKTNKLIKWFFQLNNTTQKQSPPQSITLNKYQNIYASTGGYLLWTIPVGKKVKQGEEIGKIYQTNSQEPAIQQTSSDMILIYKSHAQAFSEGEQIGKKAVLSN